MIMCKCGEAWANPDNEYPEYCDECNAWILELLDDEDKEE